MTSQTKPDTLLNRKRQVVKDAIWDAATDLFAEKGYDETTIEEIVHAAGVSQRSFFRYFSSKSDLMAYAMVGYGDAIVQAIAACPRSYSPSQILRHTVLDVAQRSAAHPRSRKTMEVLAKYPAARAAEISRLPEVQDRATEAFARRNKSRRDDLAPRLLAGLTLHILGVTMQSWFTHPQQDVSATADEASATIRRLMCAGNTRK